MPIEFIGISGTHERSEIIGLSGPVVQPDYLRAMAIAHEAAGFDRILVAHSSSSPDGIVTTGEILNATTRLKVLLAHRPGFLSPTLAARALATIDAFHPGRIAVHIISGGDDADQARDGDFYDKEGRYRRTDEFLDIVEREWSSTGPFDYEGEFYTLKGAYSEVRPPSGHLPIYFGGASEYAVKTGGRHADVYAFWGEPLSGIAQRIADVKASAAAAGRSIDKFSVSLRPIVADTEEAAWSRAREILELTEARVQEFKGNRTTVGAEGSQRLLKYAADGDVHDSRLFTAIARATGAAGNSTALVGSYEQVADALLEYVEIGATTLLIRGYVPLLDAVSYGRLVSIVREKIDNGHLAERLALVN
jgi:alkanesulfonate monooxygenase